jgi:hypothetical protein
MPTPIEAYTADGALSGVVPLGGRLRDLLEIEERLPIDRCRRRRLDGVLEPPADVVFAVDDLLLVVSDGAELPVHAVWHDVRLVVGPYAVEGRLPTLPGFDPARALARPTGTYVLLRDAAVELVGRPGLAAEHPYLLVNRYAVDEVAAELMLGFFFPGAALRSPRASAGVGPPDQASPGAASAGG